MNWDKSWELRTEYKYKSFWKPEKLSLILFKEQMFSQGDFFPWKPMFSSL